MARFRVSGPARADIARILATSVDLGGPEGRQRYSTLLAAAIRQAASDPEGRLARDRGELLAGARSLHLRHVRVADSAKVKRSVHSLFYRNAEPGLIEILRVLHERMDPILHLGGTAEK